MIRQVLPQEIVEWKLNTLLGNNDRTTNRPTDQPIYRRTNGSKGSFTSNMILNCSLTLPEHKSQMTLRRGHCLSMPSITYHNATYLIVYHRALPYRTVPCAEFLSPAPGWRGKGVAGLSGSVPVTHTSTCRPCI